GAPGRGAHRPRTAPARRAAAPARGVARGLATARPCIGPGARCWRTAVQNRGIGATVITPPHPAEPEGAPLPAHFALPDPSDLPALHKALEEHDPERRLLPLGLHRMIIDADAVPELADVVAAELDRAGHGTDGTVG